MSKDHILYLEKHHLSKWTWFIILPIALLFWWVFVKQIIFGLPVGSKPMSDSGAIVSTILFGILLPIMFVLAHGKVRVMKDEIIIQFTRLYRKRILISNIKKLELLDIQPLQEFGGWGIRYNGAKWGFILEGSGGVEISTIDNQVYVVSSKNSKELYTILKTTAKEVVTRKR